MWGVIEKLFSRAPAIFEVNVAEYAHALIRIAVFFVRRAVWKRVMAMLREDGNR